MNQKRNIDIETMKMPPSDIKLEEFVLGAILLESNCLHDNMVSLHPELFYKEAHSSIFLAIKELYHARQPVDIATVVVQLRKMGLLESVGGAYYISALTCAVASSANVEAHIYFLKELYIKRKIIKIASEAIVRAYEHESDALEEVTLLDSEIAALNEYVVGKDAETDLAADLEERFIYHTTKRENKLTGVPTGNDTLNALTLGFQNKDMIILAARSSMGKTAKGIDIAKTASQHGYTPLIYSIEMGKEALIDRLLSNESRVSADIMKYQTFNQEELKRFGWAKDTLAQSGIEIIEKSKVTPLFVRASARRIMRKKKGKFLIIIDYLQLMQPDEAKNNREQEVSSISRALKAIAKELNVPVIALSQLSRKVEERGDHRPQLSDLRESGAIEQDADVVMMLYRPSYYVEQAKASNITAMSDEEYELYTEIIVAKHRNGALGKVKEYFYKDMSKFTTELIKPF